MKNKILAIIFLLISTSLLPATSNFSNARELAEMGFWQESLNELNKVPVLERNADYKLLEAFAKVMTNQASESHEQYILKNASLENQFILLLKNEKYNVICAYAEEYEYEFSKEEKYLIGLAYLGLNEYEMAEKYLGTDSVFALFYTAYCQYAQGKISESYENFSKVTKNYPAHKLGIESHIYGAKCLILLKDYDNAIKEGKFAINKSVSISQKVEAALLIATLYQDMNKQEAAIEVLKPLASSYSLDAVSVKFKLAEIYAYIGDVKASDSILNDIQSSFAGTEYAEAAAFRRGQIFFENQDYFYAKQYFTECANNYPKGKFFEEATYYSAYSSEKLGKIDEAILLYLKITSFYKDSIYAFNSHERLAFLFFENKEYERALNSIKYIQETFPMESAFSSVNNLQAQIEFLLAGEKEDVVELLQLWNKQKKASTLEGMKTGLSLAKAYFTSTEDSPKAVAILEEILSNISENTTSYEKALVGAEGNTLLALYNCMNTKYIEGSELYLKAASFYMGIDTEKAAESMYKAALALSNAKKYQDVRLVYNKMKTLYPLSTWTEKTLWILDSE